ncbi:PREDICTED: MAGUK p55 subfamily member 3 isoform X3 [Calidris pugnax]|uniref:MAGUK p55 subfamily member 3 isoform X3 n=1 Tax=Calidris pugnax TaxID=198806 RepID=UPI00071C4F7C|nr:PREDICTED: MAGUK p55 subfamily member 3 isoform X3 [Calidris pugnax]
MSEACSGLRGRRAPGSCSAACGAGRQHRGGPGAGPAPSGLPLNRSPERRNNRVDLSSTFVSKIKNKAMPVLSEDSGLHETLALLTSQLRPDSNHKEEMGFLRDVFSEKSLSYLMKIHEKLRHYERQSPTPVLHSAAGLVEDVIEELQTAPVNNEEKELLQLLSTPHLRAMLVVHDTVAQKNFDPVLPPLPDNFDDDFDEESVKIVRLVKNKEPLGATIRRDEHTGAVIVARIMRGGAADRSGLVHVGDELREVNGITVLHKRPEEISQILAQSQGSITLKIIPAIKEEDRLKDSKVFMRALFCYNPKEDRAIPCQEAGLPFKRRHVLEVVSQDDPTWWQAKRVGDTNLRAGLIPSKQFQERRLTYRRTIGTLQNPRTVKKPLYDQSSDKEDCDCEGYFNGQYIAGLRRSFRLSRKEKENNVPEGKQAEQGDAAEFLTYEEVTKYQQQPGEQQRLVVLIGCLGAKLSELKQKVVSENPQEYGVAVPHTTRSKKSHEREGVEYNFVSKQSFETDVQQNKFVEHGEYKENLYGTSLEAIRSVMAKKKAVKHLRTPEFKPYVIFVKPLIPEKKKHTLKSPMSEEISSPLQDEEQQEIINSAAFIEEQYGHLIDTVLVKEDLQSACNQLKTVLEKLNKDSFWVPVNWVRS